MAFHFMQGQGVPACVGGRHGRGLVIGRDATSNGNLYYVVLNEEAGEGDAAEHQLLEVGLRLNAAKLTALLTMLRLHCGCGVWAAASAIG